MTARSIFLISLGVGAFAVFVFVTVDRIYVKWVARNAKRDLGKIGLRVDDEWLENRERRR